MFLYKEDFNKFLAGLTETINYVKTDLMPDFDFDAFNHDQENEEAAVVSASAEPAEVSEVSAESETPIVSTISAVEGDSVDDWKI